MRRAVAPLLLAGATGALPARPAAAQRVTALGLPPAPPAISAAGHPATPAAPITLSGPRLLPAAAVSGAAVEGVPRFVARPIAEHEGWAPVASAVIPGSGQAMLGQSRFVAYLAVEVYAWLRYLSDSHEGARQRTAYRDLARNVARSPFQPGAPVGTWDYYERMEHFTESGVYDVVPGGPIDPEPDTLTYNGSVWLLARQTYWSDPEVAPDQSSPAYQDAVAFYRQRAVTPSYRWSWRGAQLEQDLFRRTIARSNEAYRRASQDLAVVIANHVLSTVDAYATIRLRARGATPGSSMNSSDGYSVSVTIPLPQSGGRAGRSRSAVHR